MTSNHLAGVGINKVIDVTVSMFRYILVASYGLSKVQLIGSVVAKDMIILCISHELSFPALRYSEALTLAFIFHVG